MGNPGPVLYEPTIDTNLYDIKETKSLATRKETIHIFLPRFNFVIHKN